jgi:stage V sporulation protein D (sporulation-specific penicillin-binding protein)
VDYSEENSFLPKVKLKYEYTISSIQKRLLACFTIITLIFFMLFFRLGYIQLIEGKSLQEKALSQWTRDLPLQAVRGLIYDNSGTVLAENYTTYNVYVRASNVISPAKVAEVLASILGLNYDDVYKKAKNKNVSEVLIKLQVDQVKALQIISTNTAGIYLSVNNSRFYPYDDLLCQVLGYTTIDGVGQSGLEAYYNKYLQGVNGYSLTESDIKGTELDSSLQTYIPAIDGLNLTLTIDYQIQMCVESALKSMVMEQNAKSASIIVMNPNNGEIVAIGTSPSFDLNEVPRDDLSLLNAYSRLSSVVDMYEPGSTFKILTLASAIDSGKVTTSDTFYDPGYRIIAGQKIKCWKTTGHGNETLSQAVNNSCNSVFMDLALRMGIEEFYDYLNAFGLGSNLGIDFYGESSGMLIPESEVKIVDLARIGFGQSVAITPLQLITASCATINGGTLYEPHLLKEITTSSGTLVKTVNPTIIRSNIISQSTSDTVKDLLETVVKEGSGKNCYISGYRIGGKTGTAQKYENGVIINGKYVSSFLGFAPADNPEYVILAVVDEPGNGVYYGSIVAAPYVKQIFEKIFTLKNIQPTTSVVNDVLATKTIVAPDLAGKSLSEACSILLGLSLQYEIAGEGGIVTSQTPAPNTMLAKNDLVLLRTD